MSRVFFALSSYNLTSFLRRGTFYAFFYIYLRTFLGLSNTLAASLGMANFISSSLGQIFVWGPLLDKKPERAPRFIVIGETIAATTYLIAYGIHAIFLQQNNQFFAAMAIILILGSLEFFWGMSDLSWRAIVARGTEGERRGRITGSIDAFGALGQVAGAIIAGFLYNDGFGFADGTIFYLVSFLIYVGALVIIILLPRNLYNNSNNNNVITKPENHLPVKTLNSKQFLQQYPTYTKFLVITAFSVLAIFSSTQIILYFFEHPGGINLLSTEIALALVIYNLSGAFWAPILGRMSDKTGRKPVIIGTLLLGAFALFLLVLSKNNMALLFLSYTVLGGSIGSFRSVSFAYAADILPESVQGIGFSFYNSVMSLAWGMAGFILGGPLADSLIAVGNIVVEAYQVVIIVSGLFTLISALIFLVVLKKPEQSIVIAKK